MCILCIASRWSRHIAAMVMPMITLWAISQFLPQGFRFEINSPKLALVGVIFVSLSWVELVTPRLSAWRTRRISAQKERKRSEEEEAAKRRKKATRRCRNCFTAYKDQTPASGRFMCTFCGHVSKRPVLDPPTGASKSSSSFSFSGSASEFLSGSVFLSVSPKDWYDRASFVRPSWGSGRNWIGVGPWIDGTSWGVNASWFGGSWPGSGLYFRNTAFGWPELAGNRLGDCVFGGDRWFAVDSCSEVVCFVLRALSQLLVSTVWVWSKFSGTEAAQEDRSNGDSKGFHSEDVRQGSSYEPKDKKARRKAEEKRLARLEKKHQEAEEKKQREEVARLVEERRRQRVKKSGTIENRDANKDKVIEEEMQTRVKKSGTDESRDVSEGKVIEAEKMNEKSQEKSGDTGKRLYMAQNRDSQKSTRKASFGPPEKPVQNVGVKYKSENSKAVSNFFSRWSAFKYQGSAKTRPFSSSKKTATEENNSLNLLNGLTSQFNSCKAPVPFACSSSSLSSNASTKASKHGMSGLVRTQTPWVNVLRQGTLDVPAISSEDTDTMQGFCKEAIRDEDDSNIKECLDKSVSNIMANISQQAKSAASISTNAKDHHPVDGEGLQGLNPYAGNDRDILTYNSKGNYHNDAISNPLLYCEDSLLVSQHSQYFLSSTASEISQIYNTDSLGSAASQSGLNDFAAKQSLDSFVMGPAEPSAMSMCESGTGITMNMSCLPVPECLEQSISCQIWESKAVSVNQSDLVAPHKGWRDDGLMNASEISTIPVDASFQQRDDGDQETHFDPEFYLPSSLFSFEEGDSRQCCCEDHMPRNKRWLKSSGMETTVCTWEELDAQNKVPPEFMDCITHSLMQDPVITADGHSYERSAIADWLRSHDTSPRTGEVLPPPPGGKGVDKTLRPNHILRCQIIEFRERLSQRYGHVMGL